MTRTPLRKDLSLLALALTASLVLAGQWLAAGTVLAKAPFTLDAIQQGIEQRYARVQHISGAELAQLLAKKQPVLLLDVREKSEFDVSHIPGAVQVAPNIWHGPFMRRFAEQAKGKTVVFYCSVGERSSKLARYVQDALKKAGAGPIYNLKGGIFAWHNAKRKLADSKGQTDFVHPYDKYWGRLVNRRELSRYQPR